LKGLVVGGAEMLESNHISVSALLRGSQGIFMVVPEFIATYVVLDLPEADNMSDLQWFWTCLDVPPKLIDLFVSQPSVERRSASLQCKPFRRC